MLRWHAGKRHLPMMARAPSEEIGCMFAVVIVTFDYHHQDQRISFFLEGSCLCSNMFPCTQPFGKWVGTCIHLHYWLLYTWSFLVGLLSWHFTGPCKSKPSVCCDFLIPPWAPTSLCSSSKRCPYVWGYYPTFSVYSCSYSTFSVRYPYRWSGALFIHKEEKLSFVLC